MQFNSPMFNPTYRKMCFFKVNKTSISTKVCTILPYINDNYIVFNKRTDIKQINNFYLDNDS